jgi:hypothetical protein
VQKRRELDCPAHGDIEHFYSTVAQGWICCACIDEGPFEQEDLIHDQQRKDDDEGL